MKGDFSRQTKAVVKGLWEKYNEKRLLDLKEKFTPK
jgi:hypothetical protein